MLKRILALSLAVMGLSSDGCQAAELDKDEAAMVLAGMGCRPNQVVAVINGLAGMASGPNLATVVAICLRDGKPTTESRMLTYDAELGWFFYEERPEDGTVRIWTKAGFKQIGPVQVPQRKQ